METIYIRYIDSNEQIPFVLTYGVHKQLQEFLFIEDNLFKLFTDTAISEEVIKIALSKRDKMGLIVSPFVDIQTIQAEDMIELLNKIFDYFSDFFLKQNQKTQTLANKLNSQTYTQ